MVSIHKVPVIVLLNISEVCFIFRFKTWSQLCRSLHVKALELPDLSKRARNEIEQKYETF